MAFALITIGLIIALAGIKNTQAQLGSLLASDFTGGGSFFSWIAAIAFLGIIGYYSPLREVSRLFVILVVLAFVLHNGGAFSQLQAALAAPQGTGPNVSPPANPPSSGPVIPSPIPGNPGLSLDPFSGFPGYTGHPFGGLGGFPGFGGT